MSYAIQSFFTSIVSVPALLALVMLAAGCLAGDSASLTAPVLNSVEPTSPNVELEVRISGSADPATDINIFGAAGCSGDSLASVISDAETGEFQALVRVAAGTTTSFSAKASKGKRSSSCSTDDVSYTALPSSSVPITANTSSMVLAGGATVTLDIPYGTGSMPVTFVEESYLPAGMSSIQIDANKVISPLTGGAIRFFRGEVASFNSSFLFSRMVVQEKSTSGERRLYLTAQFSDRAVYVSHKSGAEQPTVRNYATVDSHHFTRRAGESLILPVALELDADVITQAGGAANARLEELALVYLSSGIMEYGLNVQVVPTSLRAWKSENTDPYDAGTTDSNEILGSIQGVASTDFTSNLTNPALIILVNSLGASDGALLAQSYAGSFCQNSFRVMYHSQKETLSFFVRAHLLAHEIGHTLGMRHTNDGLGPVESAALCTSSPLSSSALMCANGASGMRLTTDDVAQFEIALASRRSSVATCLAP